MRHPRLGTTKNLTLINATKGLVMHTIKNFITFTSLLFLLSAYSADNEKPDINKPNVVIFFTDDQGTLDVNCYGSKDLYTPNMDKLAEDGVRFTQAYAHMVCCPARAMLMTGRHPQRSNVNNWTQGNAKGPKKRNSKLNKGNVQLLI